MRIKNETAMLQFGEWLGSRLSGGEMFELIGDVGAGKTTLARGVAKGLSVEDPVQSPTFTISREYACRDSLRLVHYDFYRLAEAGVMADELHGTLSDSQTITIVEWSTVVADVLPEQRLVLKIEPVAANENERELEWSGSGRVAELMKEYERVIAA